MTALLVPLLLVGALELPATAEAALATGAFEATPAGFRIVALSHLADGCAARRDDDAAGARRCVERALARALATRPPGTSLDDGKSGLWLTHLALILGAGDATGPCLDEALHRRLTAGLAAASIADPTGHTSSYANRNERWPADQAATLAALARFDKNHGAQLLDAPLQRYRTVVDRSRDTTTSLPWSELSGQGSGKHPRGCALSWTVRYLSEVDRSRAAAMWAAYREHYLVDRGMAVGFREWPPGIEGKADVDSGPIVMGVGASATAFAIAAARAMDDDALALRLETTAAIVQRAARVDAAATRVARSTLAEAIRYQAAAQPSAFP